MEGQWSLVLSREVPWDKSTFKPICPSWEGKVCSRSWQALTCATLLLPGFQERRGCQNTSTPSPGPSSPDTSAQFEKKYLHLVPALCPMLSRTRATSLCDRQSLSLLGQPSPGPLLVLWGVGGCRTVGPPCCSHAEAARSLDPPRCWEGRSLPGREKREEGSPAPHDLGGGQVREVMLITAVLPRCQCGGREYGSSRLSLTSTPKDEHSLSRLIRGHGDPLVQVGRAGMGRAEICPVGIHVCLILEPVLLSTPSHSHLTFIR